MTARAVAAEAAAMRVVAGVAGLAVAGQCDVGSARDRVAVTGAACGLAVRAFERIVGLALVIEAPARPARRRVAALASSAERALVGVVAGVASLAGLRGGAIRIVEMAFGAGHSRVQAGEREARQVMIEAQAFAPALVLVTVVAAVALLAAMRIVGAVAVEGPSGDTFTAGASFTARTAQGTTGGSAKSNMTVRPQTRITTGTGGFTAPATLGLPSDFVIRYNTQWLIEKNGHRSPLDMRADWQEHTLSRAGLNGLFGSPVTLVAERCGS